MSRFLASVVSSYIYDQASAQPYSTMGARNRWVHGFIRTLARERSGLHEIGLQFHPAPEEDGALAELVSSLCEQSDLLICPGTDSAMRVSRLVDDRPIVYFGAHPENNGMEILEKENVTGVRLNLPLLWSYSCFRLLRELLPDLERVYFLLNIASEFAFSNVRQAYRAHARSGGPFWIPGDSDWIGYRSVSAMAERLGVQYFEGVYEEVGQLQDGLTLSNAQNSVYVGFNDSVLNERATAVLLVPDTIRPSILKSVHARREGRQTSLKE